METKRYILVMEKTETGYSAFSPDVLDCESATGDTEEQTREKFMAALKLHLDGLRKVGAPLPEPNCTFAYVEVPTP